MCKSSSEFVSHFWGSAVQTPVEEMNSLILEPLSFVHVRKGFAGLMILI